MIRLQKQDWIDFTLDFLAITLGVFITFGIQGVIDKGEEEKAVKAALQLVRDEISQNKADLEQLSQMVGVERKAATYMWVHQKELSDCPKDSIQFYGSTCFEQFTITQTKDALELMKSSQTFQNLDNPKLALAIIKAYDQMEAATITFNTYDKQKQDLRNKALNDEVKQGMIETGSLRMKDFFNSVDGLYYIYFILSNARPELYQTAFPVMDDAIKQIDEYIK